MIFIYATYMENDDFFYFLKILNFGVVRRVKGQKIAQNYKKLYISGAIHHMILIYGPHM